MLSKNHVVERQRTCACGAFGVSVKCGTDVEFGRLLVVSRFECLKCLEFRGEDGRVSCALPFGSPVYFYLSTGFPIMQFGLLAFVTVVTTGDPAEGIWWKLLAFFSAAVTSLIAAPLVARGAVRLGVVDSPDGNRKLHDRPIPLAGGPTLTLSLAVGVAATLWWYPDLLRSTTNDMQFLLALFLAVAVILIVGLIDDRSGLRGRQKLAGQVLAALILLPSGIIVRNLSLFGSEIPLGDFGPIITLLWLVGAMNALNLIDGVDGLASTTGIVICLSVAAVTYICGGRPDGLLISLVLAGGLSGFLFFNFPPARMFLGDSGSMLIGLVLGAIALKCSIKQSVAITLVMPTAIWAIPLFDVSMAIVRRKLTGRSVYYTDRGHLHHCLERKGLSGGKLLAIIAGLCALTGLGAGLGALASMRYESQVLPDLIPLVGVLTAVALLVLTRSFGHTEMGLLSVRLKRFVGSFFQRSAPVLAVLHDEEVRLNGDHNWQQLWETLTEFAERFQMDTVELMVHLPRIGEEYHASWKRKTNTASNEEWKSEIPLIVEDMRVGYIRVVGAVGEGSICKWMSDLIGGLQSFENELVRLIEDLRREKLGAAYAPKAPASRDAVFPADSRSPGHSLLSDSEQFVLP